MRIVLVSLNIWGLPWPIGHAVEQRTRKIGEALADLDADVACFQEVWTGQARSMLIEAGARSGFKHRWHREATRGGSGLLVVSRLPITSAHFEPFVLCGLPQRIQHGDYYGGKGLALLQLETDAGPVVIGNTHLHAAYGRTGNEDPYRGHRVAEMIQIATALARRSEAIIFAGDFNAEESGEEMPILSGLTGLTDVAAALERRQDTVMRDSPYRPGSNRSGSRIDYVLTRSGASTGIAATALQRIFDAPIEIGKAPGVYSDHAGLRVEVEIDPAARPSPHRVSDEALASGRRLLAEGRASARNRRCGQRAWAGGSALAAVAAAAGRSRASRRSILRAGLASLTGLAAGSAAALLGLAEGFTDTELRGYDLADRQLGALARHSGGVR